MLLITAMIMKFHQQTRPHAQLLHVQVVKSLPRLDFAQTVQTTQFHSPTKKHVLLYPLALIDKLFQQLVCAQTVLITRSQILTREPVSTQHAPPDKLRHQMELVITVPITKLPQLTC